jgi:diguanylate cyclase (GGDEF)-like protein
MVGGDTFLYTMIRLQISILEFLILLIIYIQLKIEGEKYFMEHCLFKFFVLSSMFVISMEAIGWAYDGQPGQIARIIVATANVLLLTANIIPLILCTLYLDFQIRSNKNRVKVFLIPFTVLFIINACFAITAPINKLYFYIDINNFYHRGSFSISIIIIYLILFTYNILAVLTNWKKINVKNRLILLLFLFPPLIGFSLQMMFYGLSTAWAGVCISILMVYTTFQNQAMKIDYLTGLYNRRQLDFYLKSKINNLSKNYKLAGIMIDIDHFKQINDRYGHNLGDRALEVTSKILKRFFNHDEFIARYAGDEFVILFDVDDEATLIKKVANLHRQFILFNNKGEEPFKLQISVGYAIYKQSSEQNPDDFLIHLDNLMYKNKLSKKISLEHHQ